MTDKEAAELKALAASKELREDMRRLSRRIRPMTTDEWFDFLDAYNEFVNHPRKPFRPKEGKKMLL